MATFIISWK